MQTRTSSCALRRVFPNILKPYKIPLCSLQNKPPVFTHQDRADEAIVSVSDTQLAKTTLLVF